MADSELHRLPQIKYNLVKLYARSGSNKTEGDSFFSCLERLIGFVFMPLKVKNTISMFNEISKPFKPSEALFPHFSLGETNRPFCSNISQILLFSDELIQQGNTLKPMGNAKAETGYEDPV